MLCKGSAGVAGGMPKQELLPETCPATSSTMVSDASSESDSHDNPSSETALEARAVIQMLVKHPLHKEEADASLAALKRNTIYELRSVTRLILEASCSL